jgi:hypothetical protein
MKYNPNANEWTIGKYNTVVVFFLTNKPSMGLARHDEKIKKFHPIQKSNEIPFKSYATY